MKKILFPALFRIGIGWIFLWAFMDKLFGLGFSTASNKSWLLGNSPTSGFLKSATYGPFKPFFSSLAGNGIVDWLFMLGLLGIGLAFTLGVARKLSTLSATLLLFLMWLSAFPPKTNPVLDEHLIYIFALQILFPLHSGEYFGLAKWWESTDIVKKFSFLK